MSTQAWRWPNAAELDPGWQALWRTFEASAAGCELRSWLADRAASGALIVPAQPLRALALTPRDAVRVVILGQDPYHGAGQAHGLAFSVPDGVPIPPSLRNIYAEIERDIGTPHAASGKLERWARQGVLLLNAVLTVELGAPASHAKRGWEHFAASVVQALAQDAAPKVFLLWGGFAQQFAGAIESVGARHLVLKANHPSPLSARRPPIPFNGCRHFSKANAFLRTQGRAPIDWCTS